MNLKRYWKLISIVGIIVVVITTYYIQTSLAVSSYPQLVFETKSGNEAELRDLTIYGDSRGYQNGYQYLGYLKMTSEGTEYNEEQSYFKQWVSNFEPNEVTRLQDEYRNFMRGKYNNPNLYLEDDIQVAYADVVNTTRVMNTIYREDYSFEIDVLNKETNDTISFKVDVPGQEEYTHMGVLDVQSINGSLKVVVDIVLSGSAGDSRTEIRIYTFDLSSKKLIGDETVLSTNDQEQDGESNRGSTTFLNDRDIIGTQRNLLFMKEMTKEATDDVETGEAVSEDSGEVVTEVSPTPGKETVERNIYVFDLETNQLKELDLSNELKSEVAESFFNSRAFIKESTIYFSHLTEEGLTVSGYSLETYSEISNQTFVLQNVDRPNIKIKNDKVYVVDSFKDFQTPAYVLVGDILTGEVLYEGEIALENSSKENRDYELQLYELEIE